MNRVKLSFAIFFTLFIIQSCTPGKDKEAVGDTSDSGTAKFAADESLKPILDQEIDIFKLVNPKADPKVTYKAENDALRLLLNDSVRLAVLSRDLTEEEKKVFVSSRLTPYVNRFAVDAVTLIVNQASTDTLITVKEIKKMLSGQGKDGINVVFDNANSSLARYLKDFSGVKDLKGKNIFALNNNKEVIKYVSEHANSIGITGLSWLNDPDADYADAVNKVKVMAVRDEDSKTAPKQYFTPSQNTLMLKQYPLTRGLYVINCTGKMGLGTSFAHFLVSEKGQWIIVRSNILPEIMPQREIQIKRKY